MTQVVTLPTRGERILDLLFTDRPALVNRQVVTPPLSAKADHNIVIVNINAHAEITKKIPHTSVQYHKADWDALKQDTKTYATLFLAATFPSIQSMWDDFESNMMNLVKRHVPVKQIKGKKNKPWLTPEVLKCLRHRDRAYRKHKSVNTTQSWQKYKMLQAAAQQKLRQSHWEYTESMLNLDDPTDTAGSERANSKKFWSYIKIKVVVSDLRSPPVSLHFRCDSYKTWRLHCLLLISSRVSAESTSTRIRTC